MSFLSSIKRAFGFGSDEDDELYADAIVSGPSDDDAHTQPDSAAGQMSQDSGQDELQAPEIDPEVKAKIFDGVIAVFNEALPDFLNRSVDPEAQSRRLSEMLDAGLNAYLDSLVKSACDYAESKVRVASDNARQESSRLRTELQQLEHQRSSIREQQLSAERRRRALDDRVKDLEGQLADVESQREQFELENRSLLNKLKVADFQPGVVEEMSAQIEALKAQLAEATNGSLSAGQDSDQAAEAKAEALAESEAERVRLVAECDRLSAENDTHRKVAGEAQAEAEEARKSLADIRTQLDVNVAMYNDMQTSFATEREARQKAEASLLEARQLLDNVYELQAQMTKVEEMLRKRDERIARLKETNKKLRDEL
ncbi:MAG: hypothetical protein K2J38_01095, partial [Muribaculaceae bacterium]|nr:hypothetical protein [Muribaculaceae bacterium]